ncbi:unnamed protein product [Auanema sp. JU1783]|nr:unnamed protein product [Auanema sp. JU1783]
MVAPSCCLEYRPTIYFWLILFFVVFPCLYITGRVITCAIEVLLRMLWAVISFIYWDSEEDDIDPSQYEPPKHNSQNKSQKEKRIARQNIKVVSKQIKASSTQTDQSMNCHISYIKKIHSSDNSDSLISDDEISQTTNGTAPHDMYNSTLTHLRTHMSLK